MTVLSVNSCQRALIALHSPGIIRRISNTVLLLLYQTAAAAQAADRRRRHQQLDVQLLLDAPVRRFFFLTKRGPGDRPAKIWQVTPGATIESCCSTVAATSLAAEIGLAHTHSSRCSDSHRHHPYCCSSTQDLAHYRDRAAGVPLRIHHQVSRLFFLRVLLVLRHSMVTVTTVPRRH